MRRLNYPPLLFHALLGTAATLLFLGGAGWAAPEKDKSFLAEKAEIQRLVVAKVRAAHVDYQRAVKMGESRLRTLHENYKLAKSTPPTSLDGDIQELRNAVQPVRLRRSRGRAVPADPEAERLIETYTREYEEAYETLRQEVPVQRAAGKPDSQIYWDVLHRYDALRARAEEKLVFNAPPGRRSLDEVLQKDEWTLLKDVEDPRSIKTRGAVSCVVAPEEHPRRVNVDIAPFYHSQGLLPAVSPARVGAFEVPVGCRTVTKRESGLKLIVRVSRGRGVAHVGSAENELVYGYLLIPPDAAYYFENTGREPLDLDYVAIPQ